MQSRREVRDRATKSGFIMGIITYMIEVAAGNVKFVAIIHYN